MSAIPEPGKTAEWALYHQLVVAESAVHAALISPLCGISPRTTAVIQSALYRERRRLDAALLGHRAADGMTSARRRSGARSAPLHGNGYRKARRSYGPRCLP